MDSNQRKLTLADLQSAPFSHSGIYPFRLSRGGDMRKWTRPDKKNLIAMQKKFQNHQGLVKSLPNPLLYRRKFGS